MDEPAVQSISQAAADFFVKRNVSCQTAWQVHHARFEKILSLEPAFGVCWLYKVSAL